MPHNTATAPRRLAKQIAATVRYSCCEARAGSARVSMPHPGDFGPASPHRMLVTVRISDAFVPTLGLRSDMRAAREAPLTLR